MCAAFVLAIRVYKVFIMPLEGNNFQVTCKCRGEWDFYEPRGFRSFAEICETIFYGTILVNRTECGHFVYDKRGNMLT